MRIKRESWQAQYMSTNPTTTLTTGTWNGPTCGDATCVDPDCSTCWEAWLELNVVPTLNADGSEPQRRNAKGHFMSTAQVLADHVRNTAETHGTRTCECCGTEKAMTAFPTFWKWEMVWRADTCRTCRDNGAPVVTTEGVGVDANQPAFGVRAA